MLPRDTEDDELDRAVDDITLPAVHTFDTLASYGRPTPALLARLQNLPPVVTSFVHHELAASDRETYTLAALLSLKGIAHNDISNVLAFGSRHRSTITGGLADVNSTRDPYEAYRRLGIDPDSFEGELLPLRPAVRSAENGRQ